MAGYISAASSAARKAVSPSTYEVIRLVADFLHIDPSAYAADASLPTGYPSADPPLPSPIPQGRTIRWVFVLILFIVIVSVFGIIVYNWKDIKARASAWQDKWSNVPQDDVRLNQTYPLTLRAMADDHLVAVTYELREAGRLVQDGKLSPASIEAYPIARFNTTYTLTAFGDGFYSGRAECLVFDIRDDCVVDLTQIAETTLTANPWTIRVLVRGGSLRDPLLCLAWTWQARHVIIPDAIRTVVPDRLRYRVDACYALLNSSFDELLPADSFDSGSWDLETLYLTLNNITFDYRTFNATMSLSDPNAPVQWTISNPKVRLPVEFLETKNASAIQLYHTLQDARTIVHDLDLPVTITGTEGNVTVWLIDRGETAAFEPTYGLDERYGLADLNTTFSIG